MPNFDDDRPTHVGSNAGNVGKVDLRFEQAAYSGSGDGGRGGFGGDRPTNVRRSEPTVSVFAFLFCLKGRRRGHLYRFDSARNEFGRAADSDIPIEDDYASTHHGAFLLEGTEWRIYDFAATNGTFVNGQRLGQEIENPRTLADGDLIAVGDSEFVFKRI